MARQKVYRELEVDVDGDLDEVISRLQRLSEEGWTASTIELDYDGYNNSRAVYRVSREDLETDAEQTKREELEAKNAELQREKRLELFLKLQAEFQCP